MNGALLLTPGEPAGIGPELACRLAADERDVVLVADPGLLERTRDRLGLSAPIAEVDGPARPPAGVIACWPVAMPRPETPGRLDGANAGYVLECLEKAADACLQAQAAGLVTGPVHKGVISASGRAFSGHTEFLARRAGGVRSVMLLVADRLRVALATTHLPLAEVAAAIRADRLEQTLTVLADGLTRWFGIERPRIAVLGLNPHAGEGGELGREEVEIIAPLVERLVAAGMNLTGPLPADTAFVPARLATFDAVLAMYHDQGLPVLKHAGFGRAVNVTLGLPFVRTSVDHGTALDIAGRGQADIASLEAAVALARRMSGLPA